MVKISKEAALEYHEAGRPGKIEVKPTKAYRTQTDLSLAYSPGVAYPCLEIQENPNDAYKYTDKGNLVAVISNGTAVLGLGDIGAMSGKPVMEGKGLLFKIYGGIDVFDMSGRMLWQYDESGVSTGSAYTVSWDLTIDGGRRLQTGVYLYRVRMSSDGSGYTSKAKKLIIIGNN